MHTGSAIALGIMRGRVRKELKMDNNLVVPHQRRSLDHIVVAPVIATLARCWIIPPRRIGHPTEVILNSLRFGQGGIGDGNATVDRIDQVTINQRFPEVSACRVAVE